MANRPFPVFLPRRQFLVYSFFRTLATVYFFLLRAGSKNEIAAYRMVLKAVWVRAWDSIFCGSFVGF